MPVVLLVALGGALGSLVRWAALLVVPSQRAATLAVNLLGCLAIGLLVARRPSPRWRAFAGTGVLGGFTTTSAVAVDAAGSPAGLVALVGSAVAGIALCRLGLRLGPRGQAPRPVRS